MGSAARIPLRRITRSLPWVDGIIVTTPTLGKRYRKFNPNIYVCPNQIDPADWNLSQPSEDDDVLRIGWFASPSHVQDIPRIRAALEWASGQPGVEVVTMGLNPGWKFKRRHIPWSNDMGVYRTALGQLDIGLAPVVETPWSVCRSDLKLLEYGMSETAAICSEAIPYQGYEGAHLRAKNSKEFLHHVKRLVKNRDEVKALAKENKEYVLAKRTIAGNIDRWQEAING